MFGCGWDGCCCCCISCAYEVGTMLLCCMVEEYDGAYAWWCCGVFAEPVEVILFAWGEKFCCINWLGNACIAAAGGCGWMGVADCDAADPTDGGLLVCCGGMTTLGGGPPDTCKFICAPPPDMLAILFMYGADCWLDADVDCVSCDLTEGLLLCGEDSILHLFAAGGASVYTTQTPWTINLQQQFSTNIKYQRLLHVVFQHFIQGKYCTWKDFGGGNIGEWSNLNQLEE